MRKPYFRLAQARRFRYLEIHFQAFSYLDSLRGDAGRAREVGPETITKLAKRIEWTDVTEKNEWSLVFTDIDTVYDHIRYKMKVPPEMAKSEDIVQMSQNQRHITDLKLRKCMKELLEQNPVL